MGSEMCIRDRTNVFGVDAGGTLLFFKIEPEYWSVLKTFLVYLNMIPETEMEEISMDDHAWKTLENI